MRCKKKADRPIDPSIIMRFEKQNNPVGIRFYCMIYAA